MVNASSNERNRILRGGYDFSQYASVDNTAAPGTLIRATTAGFNVNVTDVIIYNAHAGAAIITLYDEDSTVMLVISVGNGETADLDFVSSLVFGAHDVWARTDQVTNAHITIAGKEWLPR